MNVINRDTLTAAQLATGVMGKFGNPVGLVLSVAEGAMDGDAGFEKVTELAGTLGMTLEEFAGVSSSVRDYLAESSDKTITTPVKYAVTAAAGGVGAVAAVTLAGPLVGSLIAGLGGTAGGGYLASYFLNSDSKGSDIVAISPPPNTSNSSANPDPNTIFCAVVPQFSASEQALIEETRGSDPVTEESLLNLREKYDYLVHAKAKKICGHAYDPSGMSGDACEQIAAAMAEKNYPPAILLVDNDHLEETLKKLPPSPVLPSADITAAADDAQNNPALPLPPRGNPFKKGRSAA